MSGMGAAIGATVSHFRGDFVLLGAGVGGFVSVSFILLALFIDKVISQEWLDKKIPKPAEKPA